jgi:hypothetical protein
MRVTDSAGPDAGAVLAVARGELVPELGDDLIDLPVSVADRPFGRDVETLRNRLRAGPRA